MTFTSPGRAVTGLGAVGALTFTLPPAPAWGASLIAHEQVVGHEAVAAEVLAAGERPRTVGWDDLARTPLQAGRCTLRVRVDADARDEAVEVPVCAGRVRVAVDGREVGAAPGPLVVPVSFGPHEVVIDVDVSRYEQRIACGAPVRVGRVRRSVEGLALLTFASPYAQRGGGAAVVYVPPGHDGRRPGPLLVGLHPWNGSIWTYAAYAELLREARERDVMLLMPSGLGNSLYTADAEDEVLRAIDALGQTQAVDPEAVSLWGASMGGAGATTIAFHTPDRFAEVTSFFGDSKYDLSTYVRAILPDEATAHLVNALDVVDNARHLPVWLVHGESDRTSPIRQSELLAVAMRQRGFQVRFDRVPSTGHSGALVAAFVAQVVAGAATARVPHDVARVTYRSVRARDLGAYGVRIVRARPAGDAFIDVERRDDGVHVLQAQAIRAVLLARGALGTSPEHPPPIFVDVAHRAPSAAWDPPP